MHNKTNTNQKLSDSDNDIFTDEELKTIIPKGIYCYSDSYSNKAQILL